MVQQVVLDNGEVHEFPDEATPEQMRQALNSHQMLQQTQQGMAARPSLDDHIKSAAKMASQLSPAVLMNHLNDIVSRGVKDVLAGAAESGQNLSNLMTGGRSTHYDFPQGFGINDPNVADKVAQGVGQYAAYGAAGGEGLLGQILAGGAYGLTQTDPNETNAFGLLPKGRMGGAIEAMLLNALTHGAGKAFEALRPTNMFRGELTPEELKYNLENTQNTNTGLGHVINSPRMTRWQENVLPHVPFSGSNEVMMNTAKQVKESGEKLLDEIGLNKDASLSGSQLQQALKEAAKEARNEKNLNYKKLNDLADKEEMVVGRNNFAKTASNILDEVGASSELKREFPTDLMSDLQHYASNTEGNNLKLSNIFKGKMGDKANDLYTQGKMYEHGVVKRLQDALQTDIDESIKNSGSSELKDQYVKSQNDYREKFAPFEDKDIVKFTRQGGDPDLMLSHFLKKGANDRATLLGKLVDKLPDDSQHLPLQMYLSRAFDKNKLNPLSLRSLYEDLGDNQKDVLIKDKGIRNKLDRYVDLVGKNTEPLSLMVNPKTGQRNLDSLTVALLAMLGHGMAGNVGALGAAAAPILGGRLATKALTSESIRNSLVKKMIENKPSSTPRNTQLAQMITQALAGQLSQGNQ